MPTGTYMQKERRNLENKANSLKPKRTGKFSEDFFSCQLLPIISGLLHLESYTCALGNVYSFGPKFFANRLESKKSLAEAWMVELDIGFLTLRGVDYIEGEDKVQNHLKS